VAWPTSAQGGAARHTSPLRSRLPVPGLRQGECSRRAQQAAGSAGIGKRGLAGAVREVGEITAGHRGQACALQAGPLVRGGDERTAAHDGDDQPSLSQERRRTPDRVVGDAVLGRKVSLGSQASARCQLPRGDARRDVIGHLDVDQLRRVRVNGRVIIHMARLGTADLRKLMPRLAEPGRARHSDIRSVNVENAPAGWFPPPDRALIAYREATTCPNQGQRGSAVSTDDHGADEFAFEDTGGWISGPSLDVERLGGPRFGLNVGAWMKEHGSRYVLQGGFDGFGFVCWERSGTGPSGRPADQRRDPR
jgi:hypothetical protein